MDSKKWFYLFLGSVVSITVFAFFGLWILLYLFPLESYMDGEFAWWMQQRDYVRQKSDEREIIFLGDSRMKAAVIPENIAPNIYNLAVGGGTPIEMYYTLKSYLENHPAPEKVFMGFAPAHYTENGCFKTRTLYFHYLTPSEEIEAQTAQFADFGADEKAKKSLWKVKQYDLRFPQLYASAAFHSFFLRTNLNRKNYTDVLRTKGQMYFGKSEKSAGLNSEGKAQSFDVLSSTRFYLERIASLCRENDIPLFIIQLPMNSASFQSVQSSGYAARLADFMSELEQKYGFPTEKDIPCYADDCFGDASHLNERGATQFSSAIKARYAL